MIITKFVKVVVNPGNRKRLIELGYKVGTSLVQLGITEEIEMSVEHLLPNSCAYVQCVCDLCGSEYKQRFARNTDVCYPCRKSNSMKGNTLGKAGKGKSLPKMQGDKHPRWNPNKSAMLKYSGKVHHLTRKNKHIWGKWPNADKIGRCGKDGGYQLDHKVSIKYGFEYMVPPEVIASIENLQIITWQKNRSKHYKNSSDLWDILS